MTVAFENTNHVDDGKNVTLVNENSGESLDTNNLENLTVVQQPRHNVTTIQRFENSSTSSANDAEKIINTIIFYSRERGDRDGATLHDMLMAHAYAFYSNATYGGACLRPDQNGNYPAYHYQHQSMVAKMGLEAILPFACPSTKELTTTMSSRLFKNTTEYRRYDNRLFTEEWYQSIQPKIVYPTILTNEVYRVAVHIRREDIHPCGRYRLRYLSNQYYIDVLTNYIPQRTDENQHKNVEITIFSQKKSFESFDEFRNKFTNCSVRLDTDRAEVWRSMMVADLLILSRSSFSFVPALLNRRGRILYFPFRHAPMPHWIVVSKDIQSREAQRFDELSAQCPHNKG